MSLRAVLNICFPYTSRAEMTSAIRATVDEYSTPAAPPAAPFSATRISQTIRTSQKSSAKADSRSRKQRDPSPDEPVKSDADESMSSTTALDPESPPLKSTSATALNGAGCPSPESITAETLNRHTYTGQDPPLDLFIRTSGVKRLSDFLLWQCHEETQIFFLSCFWPDFDLWHFVPVLLEWQWRKKKQMEASVGSGGAQAARARRGSVLAKDRVE